MITNIIAIPARKLSVTPGEAVISITSPRAPYANVGERAHVLRLQVHDLDVAPMASFLNVVGKPVLFEPDDARLLWEWFDELPADVATLVVHCDHGVSRSCAVAQAIADDTGARLQMSKLAAPNRRITRIMREVREGMKR